LRKFITFSLYVSILMIGVLVAIPSNTVEVVKAQNNTPSYAKWGTLAIEKVEKRYPNAQIVDYLHIGRETNPKTSIERFKLWLKEKGKEFGVFVNIEFDTETEQIINITFSETDR
jgi:hypothetical protein